MASETIVAVFPSLAHAEAAISDLTASGIPQAAIRHYARDQADARTETSQSSAGTQHRHGFWAWLTGEENNTEHHAMYDRSIESGRTVVTVVADQSNADQVHATLDRHEPLDLDDRDQGYATGTGMGTAAGVGGADLARRETTGGLVPDDTTLGSGYATGQRGSAMTGGVDAVQPGTDIAGAGRANFGQRTAVGTEGARAGNTEEVIPLSEETVQVGKRAVDGGTTRVRRYVVERPVEEQIRLRDETVNVFRRPASGTGETVADAFRDREVVVNETSEEAVVGKSTRVVEEVVVQKGVAARVETVRDTVRREEVEIDGPAGGNTQGNAERDIKRDPRNAR